MRNLGSLRLGRKGKSPAKPFQEEAASEGWWRDPYARRVQGHREAEEQLVMKQ